MVAILNFRFYCVNTSYPMDNMLNRSAPTGPPNVRKRRPVFPPAGRSSHCTRQVAHHTSFLSRQPDVIASFSFGACTACMDYFVFGNFFIFCEITEVYCFTTLLFTSSHIIDHYVLSASLLSQRLGGCGHTMAGLISTLYVHTAVIGRRAPTLVLKHHLLLAFIVTPYLQSRKSSFPPPRPNLKRRRERRSHLLRLRT